MMITMMLRMMLGRLDQTTCCFLTREAFNPESRFAAKALWKTFSGNPTGFKIAKDFLSLSCYFLFIITIIINIVNRSESDAIVIALSEEWWSETKDPTSQLLLANRHHQTNAPFFIMCCQLSWFDKISSQESVRPPVLLLGLILTIAGLLCLNISNFFYNREQRNLVEYLQVSIQKKMFLSPFFLNTLNQTFELFFSFRLMKVRPLLS